MGTLTNILNKGLEVFDNIKLRDFQLDLARQQAAHDATMNASVVAQNVNAGSGFDFTTKEAVIAGAGLLGVVILGFVVAKAI